MIAAKAIFIAVIAFGALVIRRKGLASLGTAASWMLSLLAFAGVAALAARGSWLSAAFVLVFAIMLALGPAWLAAFQRTARGTGPDLARKTAGHAMKREEALAVLELRDPLDPNKLEQAYRGKMRGAHPDLGGSHDLAARINLAKQVLEKSMFLSSVS